MGLTTGTTWQWHGLDLCLLSPQRLDLAHHLTSAPPYPLTCTVPRYWANLLTVPQSSQVRPGGGFFKLTHSSLSDPRLFPGLSHSFPFLQPIKMSYTKPGVVLHACNPSTQTLGQEDHELTASLTNLPESMASGKPPAGRNTSTSGLALTSQQTQQRHSANR